MAETLPKVRRSAAADVSPEGKVQRADTSVPLTTGGFAPRSRDRASWIPRSPLQLSWNVGCNRPPDVTKGSALRAAILTGDQTSDVCDVATPPLGPTDARVRVEGTGVCASSIPLWQGRAWFSYPLPPGAPGHEGWGVVDAVGNAVSHIAPGTRVAMVSSHAFAEYDVCDASALVPLPDTLHGPFPGEPLACAVNVMRRIDIPKGTWVAVVGIGFLGAVITQLAALAGARVIAISRRRFALDLAKRCGACEMVAFDDANAVRSAVQRIAGDEMLGCVIEAVGTQEALDVATSLTGLRGKLVIAGYHQDGKRQVDLQHWNWNGIDVINAHERDVARFVEGMRAAAQLVADGTLDISRLLSDPFPLERLDEAFAHTVERPDGFVKAIVSPRRTM
jgi:threonine dehydrogenase-like Zn-dependent dehydrogenase